MAGIMIAKAAKSADRNFSIGNLDAGVVTILIRTDKANIYRKVIVK